VAEAAYAGGEDFGGDNEGGRIRAKVEEELEEDEARDETARVLLERVVLARHDRKDNRVHRKPHNLDLLAPQVFDREQRKVVAREEPAHGDDDVRDALLPEELPGVLGVGEPERGDEDGLVEGDAVEDEVGGTTTWWCR